MIQDTIAKIEKMLQSDSNMEQAKRDELLHLLTELENELSNLPEAHSDSAFSVSKFTEASAHEATRKDKKPNLLSLSLEGLKESVVEFEETHPQLVAKVNAFIMALAGMGI